MKPGWVDEIAKQIDEESKSPIPVLVRRTMKQTKAHDYSCGMNGWRKGKASQKIDRVLGPIDEEG